jgi:hypothetical protein
MKMAYDIGDHILIEHWPSSYPLFEVEITAIIERPWPHDDDPFYYVRYLKGIRKLLRMKRRIVGMEIKGRITQQSREIGALESLYKK